MLSEVDREKIHRVKEKVPKPRDPEFEHADIAEAIKDRQELPGKASEIEPIEAYTIEAPIRDSVGAIIEIIDKEGEIREFDIEHLDTELVADNIAITGPPTEDETIGFRAVRVGGVDMELPIPEILNLGTKLDGQEIYYRVVDKLGHGGMATVFLGLPCNKDGQLIKRLKPVALKFSFDQNRSVMHERQLREIALHAAMHPSKDVQTDLADKIQVQKEEEAQEATRDTSLIKGVPAFYGAARIKYGETEEGAPKGNAIVVAQEYCPGKDLAELLGEYEGRQIPVDVAMRMMLPVAKTLMEMHAQGILYRDIKPANIMADKDHPEQTTLVDFGLTRDAFGIMSYLKSIGQEDEAYIRSELMAGTPVYFSPRAAEGHVNDPANDVYSLGLTFLELIGAIEFDRPEGAKAFEVIQKIARGEFVKPVCKPGDVEFEKKYPTKEEQEFVKLLFEMIESPARSEKLMPAIQGFREQLDKGEPLTKEERFRLVLYLASHPSQNKTEKKALMNFLKSTEHLRVLEPEQKEELKKAFNTYLGTLHETISHRGMFEVCRRLDKLVRQMNEVEAEIEAGEYPGDVE